MKTGLGHASQSNIGLIRFDRKTWAFLIFLLVALILSTAFEIHGSSVGVWNTLIAGQNPQMGILAGMPKRIRQDEWLGSTIQIISQAESYPSFPAQNSDWGSAEVPLIANLPVRHWSVAFRPQYWGFFTLNLERGFAFYWNMKAFFLLGGTFLLLMLLTENDFGISVFGAMWIFFSGFMQWWYSSSSMLPEMVGCVALLLVGLHYLALSSKPWQIILAALLFSACLFNSAICFYPPFQVPLLYLGMAILAGSIGPRLKSICSGDRIALRLSATGLALLAVGFLGALYYRDAQHAIAAARSTVYPGARMVSGGDLRLAQVFGGFYGVLMTQDHYPDPWFNVCEASNFVLLFPVPMVALLCGLRRKLRVTPVDASLIAYLIAVLVWITVGWPRGVAIVSGFGLSWGPRSLLGLGLGSIFLCCTFLARNRIDVPGKFMQKLLIAAGLLLAMVALSRNFNHATNHFALRYEIFWVCIVTAAAGYFLLARQRIALAACILIPGIWTGGQVNPIARGLAPILQSKPLSQVSQLVRQDPGARWAVYGTYLTADLLKAAGAQVFNGTRLLPPLEDLRVLDPSSGAEYVYNRYAHIELASAREPIASFTLNALDYYTIAVDPASDSWRKMGIRYVALPSPSADSAFLESATLLATLPEANLWVYEYHWAHKQ